MYRPIVWVFKGWKGLAGRFFSELMSAVDGSVYSSRIVGPAMGTIKRLEEYAPTETDLLSTPLCTFKRLLLSYMYAELTEYWSQYAHSHSLSMLD